MCRVAYVDGQYVENIGQLRYLLGSNRVITTHNVAANSENCLCPVDFEKTAIASGAKCERMTWDKHGSDDWIVTTQNRNGTLHRTPKSRLTNAELDSLDI